MKPIKLTIAGLNSYIEKQTIDFKKLTGRGLFGIFGPTGCGKSTILDAMILSLYGHKGQKGIPRSTSEFINTAVDTASISYQFSLETDLGYREALVERKFKRTNTGVATASSRLQLTNEAGVLVEVWDKTNDVTNQIVELIGLTREDFMRSVVLPQGRFSEFLTLEGKERRDMLERLLDLKVYGSQLQFKIKRRGDYVKENMLQMEGEMKRYSDLSPEMLDEKRKELEAAIAVLTSQEEAFKKTEVEKAEGEQLYKSSRALEENRLKMQQLTEEEAQIALMRRVLKKGVLAQKVWAYYMQFVELKQNRDKLSHEEKHLRDKLEAEKVRFEEISETYEAFVKDYSHEKELLTIRKNELEKASEFHEKAQQLIGQRNELIAEYRTVQAETEKCKADINQLENEIDESEKKLERLRVEKEKNLVGQDERERAQVGLAEEKRHKESLARITLLRQEIEKLTETAVEKTNLTAELQAEISDMKKAIERAEEEKEGCRREIKTLSSVFFEEEKHLTGLKHRLIHDREKHGEKKSLEEALEKCDKELAGLIEEESILLKELEAVQKQYDQVEEEKERYWKQRILTGLSQSLSDGEACPLCGSVDHPKLHEASDVLLSRDEDVSIQLRSAEMAYEKKRMACDALKQEMHRIKSSLEAYGHYTDKALDERTTDIAGLEKKLEASKHMIEELEKESDKQEARLKDLKPKYDMRLKAMELGKNEGVAIETQISIKDKQVRDLTAEVNAIEAAYAFAGRGYRFEALNGDIRSKDMKRKNLDDQEAELGDFIRKTRVTESFKKEKFNALKVRGETTVEKGSGLKDRIEEYEKQVRAVVADGDIIAEMKRINESLKKSGADYEALTVKLKQTEKSFTENRSAYEGVRAKAEQTALQYEEISAQYEKIRISSGFETTEVLIESHVDEVELESIQRRLTDYEKQKSILEDRIRQLERETAGRAVDEAQWEQILGAYEMARKELAKTRELKTQLQERFKQLEQDFEAHKQTLLRYRKFEKAQDVVSDLLDLVRGNKFVEYVSLAHLRYIALDASERLMDITNHRYSLELDAKGNFIICDHFNGGVKRDTKTLSGGETFLTALSLSLALSSQIQLKGKINLEFFFLDEGFGTLDGDLLDTVMTSLEKLFEEKLTVGIISHVDELKNRVPIKLIVEPAEAGVRGTQTRIEVT